MATMVINPQERPYIANVLGQLEDIQPAPAGQDTTRIWAYNAPGEESAVATYVEPQEFKFKARLEKASVLGLGGGMFCACLLPLKNSSIIEPPPAFSP